MSDDLIERIEKCQDNIDECANLLQEASAEIKRLRESISEIKEEDCMELVYTENKYMKQLAAKDTELAKLKQIAIEATARGNYYKDFHPNLIEGLTWELRPCEELKTGYREQAAKELSIQISQEDDGGNLTIAYMLGSKKANERLKVLQAYVKRLEEAFVAEVKRRNLDNSMWLSEDNQERYAEKDARDALERIRHADSI